MEITWHGQSCFKIKSGNATIVTDPFGEGTGLKVPKLEADIVTVSHNHFDHSNVAGVSGEPTLIDSPGELEIKEIGITGVASFHDGAEGKERGYNTIFAFDAEGMRVCHLGDLGQKLSDEQLEELDGVDILMVPIGGKFTLDSKQAAEVIAQIEPSIIIPMHYKIPGLTIDIEDESKFLHEMGVKDEPIEKFVVKASTLPEEGEKVVVLKPKA